MNKFKISEKGLFRNTTDPGKKVEKFKYANILEVSAGVDKLEKKSDSFTDTLEVSDPVYSEELAAPNSELQVSYTVRNHGVHKITALTLNGTQKDVTLYPGESTVLTETVAFGNAVQDHPYSITATSDGSYEQTTRTIRFNIPKVSVQEVSVREVSLSADAGKRTVDVMLGNSAGDTLSISGSGKTLTVQLFSDMMGEHPITGAKTVNTSDYRRIDNSSVAVSFDTTVDSVFKSLGQTGDTPEIPESGLPVFAIAQVKDEDGILLSTSVNMTALKPMTLSDDEGSIETQVEAWKQDTDEAAGTNTATAVVSFTNTSLKEANKPNYTLVKVFDETGLLLAEQFKKNSGSVNAESMALDEIAITLPTGKTVSLITAEAMDNLTLDERLTASGYSFGGWYADKEYKEQFKREVQKDGDGNLIYVPITVGADGTLTVYTRWTRISSGGAPAKTITAPVTGDAGTVTVTATVKGTDATIAPLTAEQVDSIVGSGNQSSTVAIDVSSLGTQVSSVTIPSDTVKAIEAAVSDRTKDADSLTIKLTEGSVTFDASAVKAITEQTKSDGLKVNLDDVGTEKLNSAQKSAVSDLTVETVLDAYVTSGSTRISDFKGGSATVSVKHTLKASQSPTGIVVWYVANDGTRTQIPTTFRNGEVVFTVTHFSNYIIAYDAEKAAVAGKLGEFTDGCVIIALNQQNLATKGVALI